MSLGRPFSSEVALAKDSFKEVVEAFSLLSASLPTPTASLKMTTALPHFPTVACTRARVERWLELL